jgi:hypothetical protein
MAEKIDVFKKRLEILFRNLGYFVESSMIYREIIILDLEFATTGDKVNVIYAKNLSLYKKYKNEIKEYKKGNSVVLLDKKVPKGAVPYKVWALSELADIEKCGYLGCVRVPTGIVERALEK